VLIGKSGDYGEIVKLKNVENKDKEQGIEIVRSKVFFLIFIKRIHVRLNANNFNIRLDF